MEDQAMRQSHRTTENDTQRQLLSALDYHRVGQVDAASAIYERILRYDPEQADAAHLMGLIASESNDHARAVTLLKQAVQSAPDNAIILENYGIVLRRAGHIDQAITAYQHALTLQPNRAQTYFNLSKAWQLQGDVRAARQALDKAIELEPANPDAWQSLIKLLLDQGQLEQADACCQQALAVCSRSQLLWLSKGAIARRREQLGEAEGCYRQVLALNPLHVEALSRLATVLFLTGRLDEGQQCLSLALQKDANHRTALHASGLLAMLNCQWQVAAGWFQQATNRYPQHVKSYANLAEAMRLDGQVTEAMEVIGRARSLDPTSAEAMAVEASCCLSLGDAAYAESLFEQAINATVGNAYRAHQNLLMCQHYIPDRSNQQLLAAHQRWNARVAEPIQHAAEPFAAWASNSITPATASGSLRIGFVSSDLGLHPVGWFTLKLFEGLKGLPCQTFVYSSRLQSDWITQRIRDNCDVWNQTFGDSDHVLAERIRRDRLDVVFDLAGHTAHNRMLAFARRMAPVQVSWAGYVGTTGLSNMDFVLADRFHVPSGYESAYCETILRMPDCYVTYAGPRDAPPVNRLPALQRRGITFGALCNPAKVNAHVLNTWGRILSAVRDSRLILSYVGWLSSANQRRVCEALTPFGCQDRVEFHSLPGPTQALRLYQDIDVALDTFPYSGGLTTCEALWMGVPTITCPGETFASRHAYSHMSTIGFTEGIANSLDEYIERALQWSEDLDGLQAMRGRLREQLEASPLADGSRFAHHFLKILQAAVQQVD